ncbi:MAG: methylglyoxal synthase [Candidatus Bipolaricaulota bacterium]
MTKLGRIALITTPEYRERTPGLARKFVYRHLYSLCNHFEVLCTGRTYDFVMETVNGTVSRQDRQEIRRDTEFCVDREADLSRWRRTICAGVVRQPESIEGMVEVAFELVEQRLDAVIHLTDWADISSKPDSMVLRRQANVHKVPIANDIDTAEALVTSWKSTLAATGGNGPVFRERRSGNRSPLEDLRPGQSVLALIAHDQMKLQMCQLVVERASHLVQAYDCILTTGTTGQWVKEFLTAAGRSRSEVDRVRCCLSGPWGGDVQVAAAVTRGFCSTVVFLQDPHTSHPHATDVMLFEQAVLLFQRLAVRQPVRLATNIEAARVLLRA